MASELEMTELEDAIDRHRDRIATLEAQLAELAAENERMKRAIADANADRDRWYGSSFRANSRASELEAEIVRLTKLLSGRDDFIDNQGLWGDFVARLPATNTVDAHETANVRDKPALTEGDKSIRWIPSASTMEGIMSGHLKVGDKLIPGGQQEPVAWLTNLGWIDSPLYTVSFDGDKSGCDNFPVYTRPSEQTVTDEMAEAASREYMRIFGKHLLTKHARLILKAAMEAGR